MMQYCITVVRRLSFSDNYMSLPHDLAGSRSKNRFRIELLWGIAKMLDLMEEPGDFTMVFDYVCDIEVHRENGFDFFQIKSKGNLNEIYEGATRTTGSLAGRAGTEDRLGKDGQAQGV